MVTAGAKSLFNLFAITWLGGGGDAEHPEAHAEGTVGLKAILARRAAYYFGTAMLLNLLHAILPRKFVPGFHALHSGFGYLEGQGEQGICQRAAAVLA
jgi:hypothetical protein